MPKAKRASEVFNCRIPKDHLTKLNWSAQDTATTAAAIVRGLIANHVKDVRPPAGAKSCEILATNEGEREQWEKLAAGFNLTVGQFAAKLLNRAVKSRA